MLAVAVSAHASTADLSIEVTLSPGLRTSPLPVTPAGIADRWRNIGSCRKTSLHNALQVEKMLRIARNGTENRRKSLKAARCQIGHAQSITGQEDCSAFVPSVQDRLLRRNSGPIDW